MPSKIEKLIAGWRAAAEVLDDGTEVTVCARLAHFERVRADELERAYREEVLPLMEALRWALKRAELPEDGEYPRTGAVYQDSWGHWYCIACGEDRSGKPGITFDDENEFVHAEDCMLIKAREIVRCFDAPAPEEPFCPKHSPKGIVCDCDLAPEDPKRG